MIGIEAHAEKVGLTVRRRSLSSKAAQDLAWDLTVFWCGPSPRSPRIEDCDMVDIIELMDGPDVVAAGLDDDEISMFLTGAIWARTGEIVHDVTS